MITHEHRALSSGSVVDFCPACRDEGEGQRVRFGKLLPPQTPGLPEVECGRGHRFATQFWSVAPDGGDKFVLSRRVANGADVG